MKKSDRSELHKDLREATKALHHRLDHHPLLAPLVRPGLTIGRYGDALDVLHDVFAAAESLIETFLAGHPGLFDYASRRKLPALRADLAALGRAPRNRPPSLPAPASIAELVGLLYAVEGTTMGARHIVRQLCRQAWDGRLPMRFFHGYGERTAALWNEFLAFADSRCPTADRPLAAATAASLFQAVMDHLDETAGHGGVPTMEGR